MGTLTFVRHGQASLGAADYDVLSETGRRQCEALGRWFAARGAGFDAVLRGSLKRHAASLAAIEAGLAAGGGGGLPNAAVHPSLDEYDAESLLRAVHAGPLVPATTAEQRRQHFRLLREALLAWTAGRIAPEGMPSHAEFRAGVAATLDHVRDLGARGAARVLVVSSGGPISNACALVLGTPPEMAVELNLRLRNSALTEFAFSARGHVLHGFNALPHLDALGVDGEALVTYA